MEYQLMEMDAFRIMGYKLETTMENGEAQQKIPRFWDEIAQRGGIEQLLPHMNQAPFGLLGVSHGNWDVSHDFEYYIAVASTDEPAANTAALEIPAATWAVFESVGAMPDAIQQVEGQIFNVWLPTSGYRRGDAPDIEVYGEGDQTSPDYRCEVWMPVVKM